MKLNTFALVLGAFLVLPAFGDEALKSDTLIKANTVNSCVNAGVQKGAEQAKAKGICECIWKALSENLTKQEFLEMDALGAKGGNPRDLESFKRVEPKVMACKPAESDAPKP